MLAMKVMAARVGRLGERGDKDDSARLIELLGLSASNQVMSIVE